MAIAIFVKNEGEKDEKYLFAIENGDDWAANMQDVIFATYLPSQVSTQLANRTAGTKCRSR
jgi:hypothetical protein